MSIELVMLSNYLIFCPHLLLLSSIFPSIRVFSNEPAFHIRWPKYWTFCISPSNEYSGLISFQFSSVTQSCLTLCNCMDYGTPGFLVHHQLPELAQTHVHWVGDAIQPSHPLSSPSPSAFNISQHQGLSLWISSSESSGGQSTRASASASVLPMNIQDWFPLGLTGLIPWQSKGLSRVFSNTRVQKHQFFSAQLSL